VIIPGDTTVETGSSILTSISCRDPYATIRFTLDGSDPDTLFSYLYAQPATVKHTVVVKARAYRQGFHPCVTAVAHYDFVDPRVNAVLWSLYPGEYNKLPELDRMKPAAEGKSYRITLEGLPVPGKNFALRFTAYLRIDTKGKYFFSTSSNDGSKLYIDGRLVVDNDGLHGIRRRSGSIYLDPGFHHLRIDYFQSGGSKNLEVWYRPEDALYRKIPGSVLYPDI